MGSVLQISISNNITTPNAFLTVKSNDGNFVFPISPDVFLPHNDRILTLDYANKTIIEGRTILRTVTLAGLYIGLILFIEGLIFFLFRYKKKSSWLVFLITNIITEGILYIILHNSLNASYSFTMLLSYKLPIYMLEMAIYLWLLKEKPKNRAIAYALTANSASFILGSILISYLPV